MKKKENRDPVARAKSLDFLFQTGNFNMRSNVNKFPEKFPW